MNGGSRRRTGSNKAGMRGEVRARAWHSNIGARDLQIAVERESVGRALTRQIVAAQAEVAARRAKMDGSQLTTVA